MFDLNEALRNWQEQMNQGDGCSQDDIDELEEHLREEMAGLLQTGLSSEEAFLLAARRLGRVDALTEEFEKVNASSVWRRRLRWMAIGVLIYLAASTAGTAFREALTAGAAIAGVNPYVLGVVSPLASVGIMALIVVLAVKALAHRRLPSPIAYHGVLASRCSVLLAVLLWFTLVPIGARAAFILACRFASPAEIGTMGVATYFGQFLLSVALPLAIAGWLVKTQQWQFDFHSGHP